MSWIWAPTFTHSTSAFARYFVNNWQLSSITTINSRRPYGSPTVRMLSPGVLTRTPTAYNLGLGDAMPPDGTAARRLQVSARLTF